MDIRELLELYLHHTLVGRASYMNQRRLIHQCFIEFNDLAVEQIKALHVSAWHRSQYQTPHHANRALKTLRAAYTWGHRMLNVTGTNPTVGIRPHPTYSRERSATESEWTTIRAAMVGWSLKLQVITCIIYMTGCRPIEVRFMEKAHLHLTDRIWRSLHTKNGRVMVYPLADQLVSLLQQWLSMGEGDQSGRSRCPGRFR